MKREPDSLVVATQASSVPARVRPAGLGGVRPVPDESHRARRIAASFGSDAERYEPCRPAYPQALVERIVCSFVMRHVTLVVTATRR